MKKLILLLSLLACVVVVDDARGYEAIGLEEWCKKAEQTWDLSGGCYVDNQPGLGNMETWDLTIDRLERLIIMVDMSHTTTWYRAPNIVNNGTIQIEKAIAVLNCAEIVNNGTLYNAGYLQTGRSYTWKALWDCKGTLINNEQGTIYNYGIVDCDELWVPDYNYFFSECENFGRVYNICDSCNASMLCGETLGRIYDFPTIDIAIDHCAYLPMIPED